MNALCLRCQRRERAPGLLVCEACLNGLIQSERSSEPVLLVAGRPVERTPEMPEWRKRALTGRGVAKSLDSGRAAA